MKPQTIVTTVTSVLCSALLLLMPFSVVAEDTNIPPASSDPASVIVVPPVIITEVQTGAGVSGHAGDEFIELYNTTDQEIDLSGWQLRYVSSTASTASIDRPSFKVDVMPAMVDGVPVKLAANEHYVLHTEALNIPGQTYAGNLTASGSLVLFSPPDALTCDRIAADALAWGVGLLGDKSPVVTASKDKVVARFIDTNGAYAITLDNLHDFGAFDPTLLGSATPDVKNSQQLPIEPVVSLAETMTSGTIIQEASCTLPEPEDPVEEPPVESPPSTTTPPTGEEPQDEDPLPTIPTGNIGLKSPQISEFLPNPASPQTDANDEFIELYNPNDSIFELSGYVLEVGLTTKRRYTMPAGTFIQSRAFLAFFSADTKLALPNSGGQVTLLDPLGEILVQSDTYGTAKDGQAWLLAGGKWQWTNKPTPNALNVVSVPAVKKASTSKASKKTAKVSAAPKTSKQKTEDPKQDVQQAAVVASTARTPIHPGVLALIGVSALLYGAYEYRHDMANKLYQFRSNRAARRELRQGSKGR